MPNAQTIRELHIAATHDAEGQVHVVRDTVPHQLKLACDRGGGGARHNQVKLNHITVLPYVESRQAHIFNSTKLN